VAFLFISKQLKLSDGGNSEELISFVAKITTNTYTSSFSIA
jgi:hypothetical protein